MDPARLQGLRFLLFSKYRRKLVGGVLFLDPIMQPFEAKQARASNYVSSDSRHQRADKEKKP